MHGLYSVLAIVMGLLAIDPASGGAGAPWTSTIPTLAEQDAPATVIEALDRKIARRLGEPVKEHDSLVTHVAFSEDGKLALSASWDESVIVWDTKTGKEFRHLTGHEGSLYWAFFFEGGKKVVTSAEDQTMRIFDVEFGKEVGRIDMEENMQAGAVSPDGGMLAVASPREKVIRLFDLAAGGTAAGEIAHEAPGMLRFLAFSPDGTQLASAGFFDSFVQVHDVKTRAVVSLAEAPFGPSGLAWAPDGKSLFLGGNDALVRWGIAEKEVLEGMGGHEEPSRGLAVRGDGKVVYFGDDGGSVRGWELATRSQVFFTAEHHDSVPSTALSPDGKLLVSGSHDGTVRFWDVATQRETLVPPGHTNLVQDVAWSADGTRLASGCFDNSVCLWDAKAGKLQHHLVAHEYSVAGVAFVGERCVSASSDNTLRFWNAKGEEEKQLAFDEDVNAMAFFAAHGARGITGHYDGKLHLVDLAKGEIVKALDGFTDAVADGAWSPAGSKVAVVGWDGRLVVFAADGTTLFADAEGAEDGLQGVLFLGEDAVVVTDGAGHVAARTVADGKEKWAFAMGEEGWVGAMALTADGKTLAVATSEGLRFHDPVDGSLRHTVPAYDGAIASMAFRPDGKVLATGMGNSTILLWEMARLVAAKTP